jgi:hypothetical protein
VSLAEELVFLGHQRKASGKSFEPGTMRQTGFDGVVLPREIVGTGSGFSGDGNQKHFNLIQELYDDEPSNKYTGKLGKGNTISQVFKTQKGHMGVARPIAKMNFLMSMVKNKLSRAPIAPDPRSIALTQKWRRGYKDGGLVGGSDMQIPRFAEGGFVSGFNSQANKGFVGQGMLKRPAGGGMSMGTQMGVMMGGSMLGQSIGGNVGTGITMAANILPWLPLQKIMPLIGKLMTNLKTLCLELVQLVQL